MRRSAALVLTAVLLASAAACGHRATADDCQFLVDKTVELTMKELKDADTDAIAEAQQKRREELKDDLKSCEGRRLPAGAMECAKKATTSEELDACMR